MKFGLNAYTSTWKKIKNFFKNKKQEQEIDANQQFAYKEEEHNHDIVLIKLNEDVSAKLPTINLPAGECQKPELKQVVEIGGWGAKKSTKKAKKLMCATTTIADCDSDKPSGNYHSDETNTMCAFKAGVESCYVSSFFFFIILLFCQFLCHRKYKLITPLMSLFQGDSGTAVEHNGVLSGIIVSNPIDKCANPIEMLNICHYLKWIEETMRSKN